MTFRFTAFSNNNFTGHVKMLHKLSEVIRIKQQKMSSKSLQKHRLLFNSLEIISIKQQKCTQLRNSLLINSFHI